MQKYFTQALRLLMLTSMLALTACGFQLRGHADLPQGMEKVYLQADASVILTRHLQRALIQAGAEMVTDIDQATAILMIENEEQKRSVLSVSDTARVREYESFYSVTFALGKKDGSIILPKQTIELRRDYSFNENVVLAKERERANLVRDMQEEAVKVMLRKIRYTQKSVSKP